MSEVNGGRGYFTSGLPEFDGRDTLRVVTKDAPEAGRSGYATRTKESVHWQAGAGAYFVVDFDSSWWPDEKPLPNIEQLREQLLTALARGGCDAAHVDMLAYTSSSSSLADGSGRRIDSGGRHLVFLVADAGDLPRFIEALKIFLSLSDGMWGVVGNAGQFLRRGIVDFAAVQPQQPTFAGLPACPHPQLKADRRFWNWPGTERTLDTRVLRDPTPTERAQAKSFWDAELRRLGPLMTTRRGMWLDREAAALSQRLADRTGETPSPSAVRELLEQRLRGHLLASDLIQLQEFGLTAVEAILNDPRKYHKAEGPDPIEPLYHDGASVAVVFSDPDQRSLRIFSQAHGGKTYFLWYTAQSARRRLTGEPSAAVRRSVLAQTRCADHTELETLLGDLAKSLKTTKAALLRDYGATLRKNLASVENAADRDDGNWGTSETEPEGYEDVAFTAARRVIGEFGPLESAGDQIYRYDGRYWRRMHDHEAQQGALSHLQELIPEAQERNQSAEPGTKETIPDITQGAIKACQSIKQQTYSRDAAILQEPAPCINLWNGELWLAAEGVDLRPHDPNSAQTHVIEVVYDRNATAPEFENTLLELCLSNEQHLKVRRECAALSPEAPMTTVEACVCGVALSPDEWAEAVALKRYLEEVIAYWIVPRRWFAAFWLFLGSGHNGKSFITDIAKMLLPPEAVEVERIQAFEKDNHGMARLIGKTLLLDDDLDTGVKLPDGFLKKTSEGRLLSANPKHKDAVNFVNRCAVAILANNPPALADVSIGTQRRLHVICLPRIFYDGEDVRKLDPALQAEARCYLLRDRTRIATLRAELSGIVNVLATAYVRLLARGELIRPVAVAKATDEFLAQSNPLPGFLSACCQTHSAEPSSELTQALKVPTAIFHASFEYWCQQQQFPGYQPTPQKVRGQMAQMGYVVKKDGQGIECYRGVRIKDAHHFRRDTDGFAGKARYVAV